MNSVSLAFIAFLLLASVALVSVVSLENSSSQERDHEDHGFSTIVPRELMCDSSGRACTHKAVRALGKGKPNLQTLADSLRSKRGKPSAGISSATCLVGYVTAYGMGVWVVFISNSACAKAIPQWQLPAVERVVSGAYCRAMSCCISGAVVGHFLGLERSGKLKGYDLLACLVTALLEKMEMEKKDGKLEGSSPLEPSGSRAGNSKTSEPPEPPSSVDDGTTAGSAISTERDKRIIIKERMSRLNARIETLNSCSWFLNEACERSI
ncbi:hypothetical protein CRG98_022147 [Punica granatum]|uniref:Uncharacterized protein n=1 Tax=Punica granatum TaxID=22663 RepID=A0A2I0JPT3_PUNGR|nr:hypothetical protein CRG98_022147 [Punica granatum]